MDNNLSITLDLRPDIGAPYKNPAQVARVVTEEWAARNLYCPACASNQLEQAPTNARAVDFHCPVCHQPYQLKSTRRWSETRIVDAGYEAMIQAIRSDLTPNLFVMHYGTDWRVRNMLLVPHFFFAESVIEKRKPLGPHARRAGWVGCNILLNQIPTDGKLRLVHNGNVVPAVEVRARFEHIRPFATVGAKLRGWVLDVWGVVRRLNKQEFTLAELYQFEAELAALHPDNHNVQAKIRQQLQILRDLGLLTFTQRGHYALA